MNGIAHIVSSQQVVSQPTQLRLMEKVSLSGDDFKVCDSTGRCWFSLDSKTFSFRDSRVLKDQTGKDLLVMKQMMFTLGMKWQANAPDGTRLFTIEPKFFSLTPKIRIFLSDGDRDADFELRGSFMNGKRDFSIVDVRGGRDTTIAECKKERAFSSVGAFFNNMIDKDCYYLNLNQGADAAFCVAICLLLDEFYHE
jgi:uncharacterized protein YxjI